MIYTVFYKTRKDGINLFRTIDAEVDENNNVILDNDGQIMKRGFYILQNETGIKYPEAIDVEGAPYTYSETTEPFHILEVDYDNNK